MIGQYDRSLLYYFALFGLLVVAGSSGSLAADEDRSDIPNGTITSSTGVVYQYSLDERNLSISILIENPTDRHQRPHFNIRVDEWARHTIDTNLSAGETYREEVDLRTSIDVLNETHTVTVSTFGNWTDITFTTTEEDLERNEVPKPYISDVEIVTDVYDPPYNTSVDGRTVTMALITVTNPTHQLYSMKLMVHSVETGGGWNSAAVPRGENRTIPAVLDEELGTPVAGEARLYTGKPSEIDGALDQVEFVGRAGEPTHVYNRTYQPVKGPWETGAYRYQNDSFSGPLIETELTLPSDVPRGAYTAGTIVVLAIVLALYQYRRR